MYYFLYRYLYDLYGSNTYLSKAQSSRCSPFKLIQHSLQQLSLIQSILSCLQYGSCFITTLVVLSTIPTSPSNNPFFYFNHFHLHISPPYLFTKPRLQTPPTILSSIPQPYWPPYFYLQPSL